MSDADPMTWRVILGRLVGTSVYAAACLSLCWLARGGVDGDLRLLAGPFGFHRGFGPEGLWQEVFALAILTPCIFAVGVWRNGVTVVLSILGVLAWVALGLWIEGVKSV